LAKLRVLFVCGRNQWRSPTAEAIYRADERLEVRSGGVSPSSRQRVTERQLRWADLVLVMERKHAARLRERFGDLDEWPALYCLDVPDDYEFMDEALVALLQERVEAALVGFLA
jgi:predicted protein tyrosine phosphatase